MKEEQVGFKSGDLTLEGLIAMPAGAGPFCAGVVCHPHPLYGGSMHNNVVEAVLEAMWKMGWATLRFNFRGVGASEGKHAGGVGEAADVNAATEFITGRPGVRRDSAIVAGYSFGAMAALSAAPSLKDLGALTLIALPIQMADAAALDRIPRPIILAAGDRDSYCPARQLEALHRNLDARSQLRIIAGADHFFGGLEPQLAEALETAFRNLPSA